VNDDSGGYPGAPPGWYPDPAGGPGQRWWDGYAWTGSTALPAVAPPPPPSAYPSNLPPPPPTYGTAPPWVPVPRNARDLVGQELRISRWAQIALAFPAVVILVDLIGAVADASQWRNFGHQFHLALNAAQNHQTVSLGAAPEPYGGFSALVFLVAVAAIVIECVWQFRAASAARAMGLPAKRSPGWGVGVWFIPVVNLWMPYQAIRDCLARDDPNRAMVLRYWLLYLGMYLGGTLTVIGLMVSTPVGVVFALGAALCALGVLATAPRVVMAIAVAHRAAVNP
jgi:hypothetical protein